MPPACHKGNYQYKKFWEENYGDQHTLYRLYWSKTKNAALYLNSANAEKFN